MTIGVGRVDDFRRIRGGGGSSQSQGEMPVWIIEAPFPTPAPSRVERVGEGAYSSQPQKDCTLRLTQKHTTNELKLVVGLAARRNPLPAVSTPSPLFTYPIISISYSHYTLVIALSLPDIPPLFLLDLQLPCSARKYHLHVHLNVMFLHPPK